ncbi:hypothetical protein [Bosea sp. (in: a-proteobacteria)]|nr:hypothetical protein [Bosea sp. (in: a-proteobacteria)]
MNISYLALLLGFVVTFMLGAFAGGYFVALSCLPTSDALEGDGL